MPQFFFLFFTFFFFWVILCRSNEKYSVNQIKDNLMLISSTFSNDICVCVYLINIIDKMRTWFSTISSSSYHVSCTWLFLAPFERSWSSCHVFRAWWFVVVFKCYCCSRNACALLLSCLVLLPLHLSSCFFFLPLLCKFALLLAQPFSLLCVVVQRFDS